MPTVWLHVASTEVRGSEYTVIAVNASFSWSEHIREAHSDTLTSNPVVQLNENIGTVSVWLVAEDYNFNIGNNF